MEIFSSLRFQNASPLALSLSLDIMPLCSPVRRTFSDEHSTGTFHSLGALPTRKHNSSARKTPVFHIHHDHDDDADQPPSPPHLANVPFPRSSSPPSPASVSPPSDTPPRTQLSRGTSVPILLSNGKPLKPSLKSSSSSPAMLMPTQSQHMHLRSRSEPSSPAITPKNVHFPETDYGLATVCVFDRSARPASLSSPTGNGNGDETETEGEDTPSVGFPFPLSPPGFNYEIDPTKSSPVPSKFPPVHLLLESLSISSPSYPSPCSAAKPLLSGSILVSNLAFEKSVTVRFTLDDWQTVSEVSAHYVVSLSAPPSCVSPSASPDSQRGRGWDRFAFAIRLEDYAHTLSTRILWLVAHYHVDSTYPEPGSDQYGPGGEWWDNNGGGNYRVEFRPVIPSPSLFRRKPRRETISAPLPPPRTHARPPATNKDHPLSLVIPSVPSQPVNNSDGPSPHLRAGKLNLCNYAPPTVRVTPSVPFPSADSPQNLFSSSITKAEPSRSVNLRVPSHEDSTSPASSTLSTPSASPTITPRVIIGGQPATPTQPHGSSEDDDGIPSGPSYISDWDWSAPSKLGTDGLRHHHSALLPHLGRDDTSDSNSLYNAFVTRWCFAQGSSLSHSAYGDIGIMT